MAIDYAKQRVTLRPTDRRSPGHPVDACRFQSGDRGDKWLALHAAWKAEQTDGLPSRGIVAKLYGSDMANRVVDRVMQIHGGMGYTSELPIERWYRDLRVTAFRGHRRDPALHHCPRSTQGIRENRRVGVAYIVRRNSS